jgi:hypothetical protein
MSIALTVVAASAAIGGSDASRVRGIAASIVVFAADGGCAAASIIAFAAVLAAPASGVASDAAADGAGSLAARAAVGSSQAAHATKPRPRATRASRCIPPRLSEAIAPSSVLAERRDRCS